MEASILPNASCQIIIGPKLKDFQIGTLPPETEILPIEREQLPQVLELIHKSFATVAANLGLTRENCPGHTSFMPMEKHCT